MEPVIEGLGLAFSLNNIALVMMGVLIGVVVGTYSSMFVASPALLLLEERRRGEQRERAPHRREVYRLRCASMHLSTICHSHHFATSHHLDTSLA